MAKFRKVMKQTWEELPMFFLTSSETGHGKDELTEYIQTLLEN
jgi:GTP-binding protein